MDIICLGIVLLFFGISFGVIRILEAIDD